MKFKVGQIWYSQRINELFLILDVDKKFNQAKVVYEDEIYVSSLFGTDLVYIGEL